MRTRTILVVVAIAAGTTLAAEVPDERFTMTGVASLTAQCQRVRGGEPDDDRCRSAFTFLPSLSFRAADAHEISVTLALAAGNGLSDVTPFNLDPWAADLQDSVEDINGGGRDTLLTAWYRYASDLDGGSSVRVTLGLIDSTDFVDTNAFSNDEHTQFLNSALVNGPNVFVPSYAPGIAGEWRGNRFSWTAVYMNVGREDSERFDFYGMEVGYRFDTSLGAGNWRVLLDTTGRDFERDGGAARTRRRAALISIDQRLGDTVGIFARVGRQSRDVEVDYRTLVSAGIDLRGTAWNRPRDNVGLGLSRLSGGNGGIERSRVAELYYRYVVTPALAVTGDVQHVSDDLPGGTGPEGWVFGLRVTTQFGP